MSVRAVALTEVAGLTGPFMRVAAGRAVDHQGEPVGQRVRVAAPASAACGPDLPRGAACTLGRSSIS